MATASSELTENTMTAEAYHMIGDFDDAVRDAVYAIIKQTARNRLNVSEDTPVLIEVADVQEAGARMIEAFRGLVGNGQLPDEFQELADSLDAPRN